MHITLRCRFHHCSSRDIHLEAINGNDNDNENDTLLKVDPTCARRLALRA